MHPAVPSPSRRSGSKTSLLRAATGVAVALLTGLLLIAWATDGFAVLTTDAARARNVAATPVAVPAVAVWDQRGVNMDVLHDALRTPGQPPRAIIVDFIFTRCITLCSTLAGVYQQLQREIVAQGLEDKVRLLSVSFDVEHDSPERLARQALLMGARPDVWSFVTPNSGMGRDLLLKTFGVQVVAEKNGQWQHNAALHVVNTNGDLVRIVDIDDPAGALAAATAAATYSATAGTP